MRPRLFQARRSPLLLIAVATLTLAVAGCDYMVAVPTARPSRAVTIPDPLPSAAPEESDEAPTLRPDPSTRVGPDLIDAANGLADLDSYRVSVVTRGLVPSFTTDGLASMTSTLVQGEDPAADIAMTGVAGFEGGRLRAVVIGDEAWLREGSGAWRKSPGGAADFDAAFTTMSPVGLLTEFEGLTPAIRRAGTAQRSGVKVIRYHTDSDDALAATAGLSAGSADVWLATTGGYLVGASIRGTWDIDGVATSVELTVDVSRINDRANRVTPPG